MGQFVQLIEDLQKVPVAHGRMKVAARSCNLALVRVHSPLGTSHCVLQSKALHHCLNFGAVRLGEPFAEGHLVRLR